MMMSYDYVDDDDDDDDVILDMMWYTVTVD